MKKSVNLGLIGFGTVGTNVLRILRENRHLIEQKAGVSLNVKRICDKDIRTRRPIKVNRKCLTTKVNQVLDDKSIDIVIELIGGYEPARSFILRALRNGKNVVTANKAVLARYWGEIFRTAEKYKALVNFEASVAAGIPIIRALNEGLAANRIQSILGILNGTTNYILTRMTNKGLDFKTALAEAKKAGFAEANPRLDIEGIDTAHKLAILASIALGTQVKLEKVYCEGISHITPEEMAYARKLGYIIKLLAIAKQSRRVDQDRIEVRVHPAMIPKAHLLTSVSNEFNAIYVVGDAVGETMFYGKGAGGLPAASAVVSDIIALASRHYGGGTEKVPSIVYDPHKRLDIQDIKEIKTKYYIRFVTVDRPGVLSRISGILGVNNVSIDSCLQKTQAIGTKPATIVMITHKAKEDNLRRALARINRLPIVKAKSVLVRIEEEE